MQVKIRKNISAALLFLSMAAVAVLFYFSGCVAISEQSVVVSGAMTHEVDRHEVACGPRFSSTASSEKVEGLDPREFSILSWNAHRGTHERWNRDLVWYGRNADIILLQEAALESVLATQLDMMANQWLMASAFNLDNREIGVMSAARVIPQDYCMTRQPEPLIRVPKIGLAAAYPLTGVDTQLLVVNIHLVNFTIDTAAVRQQIETLEDLVRNHDGPVIVAGDFNTWSDKRESLVRSKMSELGMVEVAFEPDNRVRFFDHTVDGIYFRGLEVVRSRSHQVDSSDHNPLEVHFRVAPPTGISQTAG